MFGFKANAYPILQKFHKCLKILTNEGILCQKFPQNVKGALGLKFDGSSGQNLAT